MRLAFFDMDRTLLSDSSGLLYVRYLLGQHKIGIGETISVLVISALYSLNLLDFPKAMAYMSRSIRGGDPDATKALCDRWFEESLVHYIAPKAVERIRQHEQQGDIAILLSASTQFAVGPVARYLNVPFQCTELEIENNHFTGNVVGMHCYADGKRYWGERIAQEHGIALANCSFYSDSYSDRSLMEAVGRPVAVNPDRKLAALARQRGWETVNFY